jgi:hypothetical protein
MSDQPTEEHPSEASEALGGVFLFLNIMAALFSGGMLVWAIGELQSHGERWGLVGVMFFGGIGLLVEFLLMRLTIRVLWSARRQATLLRVAALWSIVVAILLDAAALVCAFIPAPR